MKCDQSFWEKRYNLDFDVAVVGGGIAGTMAAAAAAKSGARTVLIESAPFLGGVVTMGPLEALMTPRDAKQEVIAGIGQEFLSFLKTLDANAVPVNDTTGYCSSIVPYDAESMKFALMEFMEYYGVTVLTETSLAGVEKEGRNITALRLLSKYGYFFVTCSAAIDATGSATLTCMSGNGILCGEKEEERQPVTVLCRVGNVDIPLLRNYVACHDADFKCFQDGISFDKASHMHLWGFTGVLKRGYDQGKLDLQRQEIHMMQTTQDGEVVINYSRINAEPRDPIQMAHAQLLGMRQVHQLHAWFKESIPAFQHSYIVQSGIVGVRESGRGVGKYILTKEDIVSARSWQDNVAMGAFPIDIHQSGDGMKYERIMTGYHIPQRCLMAQIIDNLFLAGRCISTTFEANASCRISMTCMATGHAAGVMAAVQAMQPDKYSYDTVARLLKEQQAII